MRPTYFVPFLVACFLILVFGTSLSANCQERPGSISLAVGPQSVPFRWLREGGLAHSALLLPLRLPGCPTTFYLQFDLGAPATLFYREAISDIVKRYPQAADTSGGRVALRNGRLGRAAFSVEGAALRNQSGSGVRWQKGSIQIIGTAGSDLVAGRALLLDFPAQRLLLNTDSSVVAGKPLYDLLFVEGRILLPASIGGTRKLLIYDSGSSAFSLLTDSATALRMALPGAADEQHASRSWERTLRAHSFATADSIGLAGASLPIRKVSYMEGASEAQVQSMARFGIGGMTGNALFAGKRLYLDLARRKFALLP